MTIRLLAALACLGIGFTGCTKRTLPPVPTEQHLPIARYTTAKLEIEKPNERKCSVWVDFTKWPTSASWNRLVCGIDHISYDARIEYLGHSPKGDRYKITIRKPYTEGEVHADSIPIAYDAEIDYLGGTLKVYEISGVSFTLKN